MVREDRPVLERFVNHHLALGASYVTLYFDDPDDPWFDHFAAQPGVQAVRCDAAHWDGMGRRRPPYQQRRQLFNADTAYRTCQTDWQAHVDADELILAVEGVSVSDVLAAADRAIPALYIPVIEPLTGEADAQGRRPFRKKTLGLGARRKARLYGDYAPLLRKGMIGHANGKSFLRAGLSGWTHGIHYARPRAKPGDLPVESDDMRLAHLHCESEADWIARELRRTQSAGYSMRAAGGAELLGKLKELDPQGTAGMDDTEVLARFFQAVSVLSDPLADRLKKFGLLEYHHMPALPDLDA